MRWVRANKGFVAFLMLFGLFRTAIADWSPIPSGSMHPNLLEGDVVLVNRLAYNVKVPLTDVVLAHTGDPKRGEIVIFSGAVNIVQPRGSSSGERFTYNMKTGQVSGGGDGGRVKILINPRSKPAAPAKPAATKPAAKKPGAN